MQQNYFIIPVSLDYGAEEYLWHTNFKSKEDILDWWLNDTNLVDFEKLVQEDSKFHKVKELNDGDLFYTQISKYGVSITLIDAMDNLSYLMLGNRKVFKNGSIKCLGT